MAKRPVSIGFDEKTLNKVDELADQLGLSRSAVIDLALNKTEVYLQWEKILTENKKAKDE